MPRVYASPKCDKIYWLLDSIGAMSAVELERLTGFPRLTVNCCLSILRTKKKIYIHKFDRQPDGKAGRCIPSYAIGDLPDAVEPPQVDSRARNAKYRKRHSAILLARGRVRRGNTINVWGGLM